MSPVRVLRRAAVGATLLAIATAAGHAQEAGVELRATLTPDPVGREETLLLRLEIERSGFRLPEIEPLFRLENLSELAGPMRSESHSWVNGVSTSGLELTWRLRPGAIGVGAVRGLRVLVGGQGHDLPDLEVRIVEETPPRPRSGRRVLPADPFRGLLDDDPFAPFRRRPTEPAADPEVRLLTSLEPTLLWVGQQALWRLLLETRNDISSFRPRSLPAFAGFWARELEQPQRPTPRWVEVDGERVARFTMMERALFPLRAGRLGIDAAAVGVEARIADGGLFAGFGRVLPLELASRALEVEVRPLPAPPPGFSSLVGRMTSDATLAPGRVEVGRATTYRLVLDGDVHFEGYSPPALGLPAGLRGFPPTREIEERREGDRLATRATWSHVLVADRPGRFEIPPPSLVYFDVASGEYRTATAPALVLEAFAPGPSSEPEAAAPAPDAVPPPTETDTGSRLPWFVLVVVVALVGVAAWVGRRRPGGVRSDAMRQLRRDLQVAERQATPRDTAKAIDAAWRLFLAERWQLAGSIPTSHWRDHLERQGLSVAAATELVAMFEELHLLEFAPELADAESMRDDLIRRSRRLRRRLR